MKYKYTAFTLLLLVVMAFTSPEKQIYPNDFKILTGQLWTGKLTYLDYSSNKKTTIPANITISQSAQNKNIWYFKNEYPKEPHANGIDTVVVSKDGKKINEEQVMERVMSNDSTITIITQKNYNDDGKAKVFRYTYSISKHKFSIKKQERALKEGIFIERNTYEYERK